MCIPEVLRVVKWSNLQCRRILVIVWVFKIYTGTVISGVQRWFIVYGER